MKSIAHEANLIPAQVLQRFKKFAPAQGPNECWLWIGSHRSDGYGVIKYNGRQYKAHRVAYYLAHGHLSPKLTVDHNKEKGCRNKGCVNPDHLEAVTQSVNTKRHFDHVGRKTHCPAGHEYATSASGRKRCVVCGSASVKRWGKNNKARSLAISRASYYRSRYGVDHPLARI